MPWYPRLYLRTAALFGPLFILSCSSMLIFIQLLTQTDEVQSDAASFKTSANKEQKTNRNWLERSTRNVATYCVGTLSKSFTHDCSIFTPKGGQFSRRL